MPIKAAYDAKSDARIKLDSTNILLKCLKNQMAIPTRPRFRDKLFHEPDAQQLFLILRSDSHGRYPRRPSLPRDQGDTGGSILYHDDSTQGEIDVVTIDQSRKRQCIKLN